MQQRHDTVLKRVFYKMWHLEIFPGRFIQLFIPQDGPACAWPAEWLCNFMDHQHTPWTAQMRSASIQLASRTILTSIYRCKQATLKLVQQTNCSLQAQHSWIQATKLMHASTHGISTPYWCNRGMPQSRNPFSTKCGTWKQFLGVLHNYLFHRMTWLVHDQLRSCATS